jgi:hypothetical protein
VNKQYLILIMVIIPVILTISLISCSGPDKTPDTISDSTPTPVSPEDEAMLFCRDPIIFKWMPYNESTEYEFTLSTDRGPRGPILTILVEDTEYEFTGPVKCGYNYYWRVRAIAPDTTKYCAASTFYTEESPPPVLGFSDSSLSFKFDFWIYVLITGVLLLILVVFIWLIIRNRNR